VSVNVTETFEIRLTDAQIIAIQQRLQRRKQAIEEAARESVQEVGIVELGCIDE
jgi:hypothetical protein